MTSNLIRKSILAACAALTLVGAVAYASDPATTGDTGRKSAHMYRHGERDGGPLMSVVRQLDLTAEQQQSVRSIVDGNADARKALRALQQANRDALGSTMPDDPNYPALIAKEKKFAADAIQQMSDTATRIYAVLTPDQKARVPQLLAERKAKWDERRQQFRDRKEPTAS